MRKDSLYNSPAKAGLAVFLAILIVGSGVGFVLGMLIVLTARCEPRDVCDAPAMMTSALWLTSILLSSIFGTIFGVGTAILMKRKPRKILKVVP